MTATVPMIMNSGMKTLAEAVRDHIATALVAANNNKTEAARALGLHRRTLYRLMRRHKIPLYPEAEAA